MVENSHIHTHRPRFTCAFQHVMNRGCDGNTIFAGHQSKSNFPEYLEDSSPKMKIRLKVNV
jgi:hypothetical protein